MTKELIISITIIILIFVGNFATENYTKQSVEETSNNLSKLRDELIKDEEEINYEFAKQKVDEIHNQWDLRYEKLAYYIEHNELEKVETQLTGLKAYIENDDSNEAIAELDKCVYLLGHIEQKSGFNLKNIF